VYAGGRGEGHAPTGVGGRLWGWKQRQQDEATEWDRQCWCAGGGDDTQAGWAARRAAAEAQRPGRTAHRRRMGRRPTRVGAPEAGAGRGRSGRKPPRSGGDGGRPAWRGPERRRRCVSGRRIPGGRRWRRILGGRERRVPRTTMVGEDDGGGGGGHEDDDGGGSGT
jgi:hypothetical protein